MQKTNLCASLLLAAALCGPMAARTALAADQSDQGSDQGSEQAAAPAQTSGVGRGSVGVGMGYLPGRLGVVPKQQGYKPTAADVQQFQAALQTEIARMGF